jgi:hypothetical protein
MKAFIDKYDKWIWVLVFAALAVLCFTFIHDLYLNLPFIKESITYLDGKSSTVMALTGAATSASVAITMLPNDIGTPIATELANISSYAILILAAVHLEKYLITIAAEVSLKFLLPGVFAASAGNTALGMNPRVTSIVRKVAVFALAILCVVPISVQASQLIEKTYKDDVQISIEETQREAEEIKEALQGKDQNFIEEFISNITGGAATLVSGFETSLNNFVEAISVMLITACLIPAATFMFLIWLLKMLLQIDVPMPLMEDMAKKVRFDPNKLTGKRRSENE